MPDLHPAGAAPDGEAPADPNSLVPSATGIRRAAMDWLARREHARCELEERLHRRFPDATAAIGPVLDQLEHEGLLSDTRFLESFTRSRIRRGQGPRRIQAELRGRGIRLVPPGQGMVGTEDADRGDAPPDVTARAAAITRDVDWLAQARATRARRFGEPLPADAAGRRRQMAFLLRRGYDSETCRNACLPPRDQD